MVAIPDHRKTAVDAFIQKQKQREAASPAPWEQFARPSIVQLFSEPSRSRENQQKEVLRILQEELCIMLQTFKVLCRGHLISRDHIRIFLNLYARAENVLALFSQTENPRAEFGTCMKKMVLLFEEIQEECAPLETIFSPEKIQQFLDTFCRLHLHLQMLIPENSNVLDHEFLLINMCISRLKKPQLLTADDFNLMEKCYRHVKEVLDRAKGPNPDTGPKQHE